MIFQQLVFTIHYLYSTSWNVHEYLSHAMNGMITLFKARDNSTTSKEILLRNLRKWIEVQAEPLL